MEHLQPTSIFSLLETDKQQRASFVNQVIETLKEGHVNPLKLYHQVKCMEQLLSDLKERPEYKEMLLEEATKHGKKFEMHNAEFSIREVGTRYDYSKTEDITHSQLLDQKAELDLKIKAREKFLQTIPTEGVVDPEHGHMVYPASKSSTTSVVVTLK